MMSHALEVQISKWAHNWTLGWLAVICLSILFSVPSGIVVVLACIQAAGALVALVWYLVAAHKARSRTKKRP